MPSIQHPGLRILARAQTARYALRTGLARELRERAGLSQGDIARALKVDIATISRWERCQRKPTSATGAAYLEFVATLVETAGP